MSLTAIEEHDTAPWNPLADAMEDVGMGEYRLRYAPARLPATYTLQAIKASSDGQQPDPEGQIDI
jgi:hypothetical protein